MKNLLITLITIFCFNLVNAQHFSFEYGKVSKADIDLTQYEKDKSAEAVVIYDKGSSYFVQNNSGYNLIFERSKRFKILKEAGIEYAEIEIPFYREGNIFEKIYDLEACTYNFENGQLTRTPLNADSWNDEIYNDYWMIRKVAMPNVKEGSIIEFRYKISSQYLFNLRDWEFQSRIPTIYSEYKAAMIPFYEYIYLAQRTGNSLETESYTDKRYTHEFAGTKYNDVINKFSMKDIPAFNSEDYITSINDYIIKIDFQLASINYPDGRVEEIMTTWPELKKEYENHSDFGKYINKCEKAASKIIDLDLLADKTANEKFEYVINFVKNNYSWNEQNGKYASKSTKDILKDQYGNAADINLLATGLLRAAGINTTPVLISTRTNGKVSNNYPFNHYFNYVILMANIDGKNILSDATDVDVAYDRIPSRCINDQGLLVTPDENVKWIGLQCKFPSTLAYDFEIDITKKTSNVKVKSFSSEYMAFRLKDIIGKDQEKLKEYLENENYKIENAVFAEVSNKNKEVRYEYELTMSPEQIADKTYINPFLDKAIEDNPLNQPSRSYPIDMTYPTKRILTSTIIIPEGYELDHKPEDYKINNNLFGLDYSVEQKENRIKVVLMTDFKESVYEADDYAKIKFYFNEIVKRGNEKIVLKKI
ncbi:DUF3857 domain-containing protein [uncultured Draconibacterium sp.]|uniref:DUF3857 domain-containing protein n=1 Tax=uncultured Draconibacterium sp. TaxID=1573823 RepID=UPI0029C75F1A|nr:DUF3857 domain-containing protein [uncultured Draconibacterium sp.]